MKILIVDDNPDARKILRYNIEHHGCGVIEAEDGQAGLEKALKEKPDIIISDALMPRMDGFQFLRAIKQNESLRDIPFVFYSAVYTGYKAVELAVKTGADAFIIKPKEPEAFWAELEGVLEECRLKKERPIKAQLIEEEEEFLRMYSDVVATKLEEKVKALEKARTDTDKSERKYENLFNSIRDVIIITDPDQTILDVNQPALRNIFGYEYNDIIGKNAKVIYADEKGYKLTGGEIFERREYVEGKIIEVECRRKNGKTFFGEISALKLLDENGVAIGNIGIYRDITERKKAQDELMEKIKELERFYEVAVDRELKMKELKEEVERLKAELSEYKSKK
ncbi:MAG: response regulator [Nitrospirae bacterium]|nr:response regulator [Nitrospirota bacterium]